MFGSKPVDRTADAVCAQLQKRHRKILKPGEVFLSACDCFPVEESHPPPLESGLLRLPIDVASSESQLQSDAAAHLRVLSVRTVLGMGDEEFSELPHSANGYLIAHTDRRLLIFDGSGRNYQLQAPMKGMWLQPIDQNDDTFTLVFNNGEERVALCTRRDSLQMTKHFMTSFPDRRGEARVININSAPTVTEF